METIAQKKAAFDAAWRTRVYESTLLTFEGVDGYDVYNPSLPFTVNGKRYLYGRVEKRDRWACSVVRLFSEEAPDRWVRVPDADSYLLEDPFVASIGGQMVLGGTHVKRVFSRILSYNGYFFRGAPLGELTYETCGPDGMKDIRLVELADGRIGVFSRPRRTFADGSEARIGFTVIPSLEELTPHLIESAPYVEGLLGVGEWGGVNQAYLLPDGRVGVIGHAAFLEDRDGMSLQVYCNTSFVLDPATRLLSDYRVIGTAAAYPVTPAKLPRLIDCVFTSGLVARPDGKADLYSGVRDAFCGRITIDDPFAEHGGVRNLMF